MCKNLSLGSNASFMYFCIFRFPFNTQILPTTFYAMQTHTMTWTTYFNVGVMLTGCLSCQFFVLCTFVYITIKQGYFSLITPNNTVPLFVDQLTWDVSHFNLFNLSFRNNNDFFVELKHSDQVLLVCVEQTLN